MSEFLIYLGGVIIMITTIFGTNIYSDVSLEFIVHFYFTSIVGGLIIVAVGMLADHLEKIRISLEYLVKEDYEVFDELKELVLKCPNCGAINMKTLVKCRKCSGRFG